MKLKNIILLVLAMFVVFFLYLLLFSRGGFYLPMQSGHKLIGSKTFKNTPHNESFFVEELEKNGWRYSSGGGFAKTIVYKKNGVSLHFESFNESVFYLDIIVPGKSEKKDREIFNQTLDELHRLFGWDISGFKTYFSVETD